MHYRHVGNWSMAKTHKQVTSINIWLCLQSWFLKSEMGSPFIDDTTEAQREDVLVQGLQGTKHQADWDQTPSFQLCFLLHTSLPTKED